MRKNTIAWRYCRFASKYWRMAGVRCAGAGTGGEAGLDWDTIGASENNRWFAYEYTMAEPPTAVLILALDTTTRAGSAAVLRRRDLLALVHGDVARTHGERLPGELAQALEIAGIGLGDIDLLAVAVGPGAFTGLRIGMAAVQGLALTTGRPVVGISALDALAAAAADTGTAGRIGAWIDASRGEVYAALYDAAPAGDAGPDTRVIDPPSVGPPNAILARWDEAFGPAAGLVVGDGAVRYGSVLAESGREVAPPPDLAPWIGRLAIDAAARGLAGPPHALRPLYVRRPDAEIARNRSS